MARERDEDGLTMPTTDEDLRKKQVEVQKLREEVLAAESQRVARESELSNDITARQLDAEAAQLQARLTLAKRAATKTAVREGASVPLDSARDAMRLASERQKAVAAADDKKKER